MLAEADKIIKHRFRILGQEIDFDSDIDWHLDPQSGYRWPLRYFKRLLPVFNTDDNTDAKFPFELSRFTHLATLGIAARISGDRKYAQEFIAEVESWVESNPYPRGVNWTCAMDVAIRLCNLITGFYLFKDSPEISDDFLKKYVKSLYQHGRYIVRNLEWGGNHYLSDIVGLLYCGVCFPELKEAEGWRRLAIKEMVQEMEKQVYPDGCDFEASTCYHRLVLELFFFGTLLTVINEDEFDEKDYQGLCRKIFGEEYTRRLFRMFEAILYLVKPNGFMPQIGDNDSGRLHAFAQREILDMRYLLTLGAIFFKESRFKVKEFGFSQEALWVFGEKGYRLWKDLEGISIQDIQSKSFPDAGWYVLRHRGNYCLVSCRPGGPGGNEGHAHNDKLSFELMLKGQDVVVDPGTFVYTSNPEERNRFRSTEYHNTVKFSGYEQNEIPEKAVFSLPERVKIIEVDLKETKTSVVFTGEIQYADLTHRRTITLDCDSASFVLKDSCSSPVPLKGKLLFHLSPGLASDGQQILNRETGDRIAVIEIEGISLEKGDYDYSPEYGMRVKAESLAADISAEETSLEVITHIRSLS